jgi:hypothetical protein
MSAVFILGLLCKRLTIVHNRHHQFQNALNRYILYYQGCLHTAVIINFPCSFAMASSPNAGQGNNNAEMTVPDEDHGVDLPMSMTASVILTHLPKDATQALADVEAMDDVKGGWDS